MRMPLIVVKSSNGPYDDEAFTAGYSLGVLNTILLDEDMTEPFLTVVYTRSIPQLDLIAMESGWIIDSVQEVNEAEHWSCIKLKRTYSTL